MERIYYHPTAAGGGTGSLVPDHLRDIKSPIDPETDTGLEPDTITPLSTEIPLQPKVRSVFDGPGYHYEKGSRGERVLVIDQ